MHVEVVDEWYEIKETIKGSNHWCIAGHRRSSIQAAREDLARKNRENLSFRVQFRIVKKTTTEEIVE